MDEWMWGIPFPLLGDAATSIQFLGTELLLGGRGKGEDEKLKALCGLPVQ